MFMSALLILFTKIQATVHHYRALLRDVITYLQCIKCNTRALLRCLTSSSTCKVLKRGTTL